MSVRTVRDPLISDASLSPRDGRVRTTQHFRALLKKNAILKRRQWSATWCPFCPFAACCELVLPLGILALLWWAKSECLSGGQCNIPVHAGWGGVMPKQDFSTECVEGLPLEQKEGNGLGVSWCRSWTQVFQHPLPFHEVLAYLYWSGKRLALAVDNHRDIPKIELMRDFISESWHPDVWMMDIPCKNLEPPFLTIQDLKSGHLGHRDNVFAGNRTLPCESQWFQLWHPGVLPNFKNLTQPKIYTTDELNEYLDSYDYGSDGLLYGAVVFSSVGGNGELGAPGKWSYTIRLNVSSQNTPLTQGPPTRPLDLGLQMRSADAYINKGFMSLQLLIDRYIIGSRTQDTEVRYLLASNGIHLTPFDSQTTQKQLAESLQYFPQSIETVPMPVEGVLIDGFYELIAAAFPIVFIVAFLYTQKTIINELITEKETKVRESLRMFGISSAAIFGSWYLTYAILFAVICSVFAIVAGMNIFTSSSCTLIFVFFWLWSMSFLSFALFVHAFFNQARTGGIVGVILMFSQWIVYASQNRYNQPASPTVMSWLMVLPNAAFCAGLDVLSKYEASKIGASWSNLSWPVRNTSFGAVLMMMLLDIILWTFMGWYLDRVLPKEFGVRLPPYFLFLPSYWTGRSSQASLGADANSSGEVRTPARCAKPENVEGVPQALLTLSEASGTLVNIVGLRREFSTPAGVKVAVAGLDLTMYEGQILAMLGHNGAGKSTTINMLTGMVAPSAGDAFVIGHSVHTGMREIRRLIGVCPQHDILWLELTVIEHLHIFAMLRGVSSHHVNVRAEEMMQAVGLTEKAFTRAGSLSGGQKRKLSLSLALIGQPRAIFLDEPTSGMDPFSRRSTWNIIRNARDGRVIILTTHFMDEADILGDRIAIMAEGELQCCGSSLFLKNRFGAGYRITCARQQVQAAQEAPALTQNRLSETVVDVIHKHVPGAQIITNVGAELSMRLPLSASPSFPCLFEELDAKLAALRIEHYGLSMVTLEEVFLCIASGDIGKLDGESENHGQVHMRESPSQCAAQLRLNDQIDAESSSPTAPDCLQDSVPTVKQGEGHVFARHFVSLFMKRARYGRRDYKSMLCMILLPVLWLAFGLWILQHFSSGHFPAQSLGMVEQYGTGRTVPLNTSVGVQWSNDAFVNAGVADVHPRMESIPAGLADGVIFGRNYSHGLPVAQMCEEHTSLFSKCFRDEYICPHIWEQVRAIAVIGFDISCRTDQRSCKSTINNACRDDASQCTDICQHQGVQVPKAVCKEQCEEVCAKIEKFEWLCDLLWDTLENKSRTLAWVCPVECANVTDPDTCAPGTTCQKSSAHHAWDPAGILSYERVLLAQGLGTSREDVQYGAVKASSAGNATVVTLLYNTSGVHVVPTLLNLVSTSIKRTISGEDSSISVSNMPMPLTKKGDVDRVVDAVVNLFSTFVIINAFSFVPAAIVAYVVREREAHHNSKHQQLLSGVSIVSYWTANLVWDLCVYVVPLSLSLIFMQCFKIQAFIANGALWATLVIFVGYGMAITPFSYLLSFLFAKHTTAQVVCLVANFISGLLLVQISYVLSMIDNTKATNNTLMWAFRLFPGFALGHGLLEVCTNSVFVGLLGSAVDVNLLDWNIAGKDVLYLYLTSPMFFGLTMLIDYILHSPWAAMGRHLHPQVPVVDDEEQDDDVLEEASRVARGDADKDVIRLANLRKVYRTPEGKPKFAVRGLSFGLPRGECFGFLGINGAGKTSTLNMLTGAILPSGGTAFLGGFDVVKEQWKLRRLLGYCPQHDALLDRLTVQEHLQLFGRIKGIPPQSLKNYCDTMMQELSLTPHMEKLAMTLSGGNKRKLSLAIAMMGSPPLIFLDEPSTGVDPAARRLMWNVISGVTTVRHECCVMLTTHNMEEAEALCTRIGIMVGGRLRCIGSNQHLKSKFSKGYQLEARLNPSDSRQLAAFVEERGLPTSVAKDDVPQLCLLLGAHHRAEWVREGCEQGHMLYEALRTGVVPACVFAEWWMLEDRAENFTAFLQRSFPGSFPLERHDRTLRFRLPAAGPEGLGGIFRRLEAARSDFGVEDYGISQASLEQIFNEFAALQEEETGPVQGMFAGGKATPASSGLPCSISMVEVDHDIC